MPYETVLVDAGLYMTHNGVNVFRTYKDDDVDQGPERYRFTLYRRDHDHHFDVRKFDDGRLLDLHPPYLQGENDTLSNKLAWATWHSEGEPAAIRTIIREALDAGRIPLPADMDDNAADSEAL
jgi:hypothetical protein